MERNEDIVPACLFRSRRGLFRRNDLVVPLRDENKIDPDRRRTADGMPGAALNSPRLLNGWRLAATSLMAYRPFPDAWPGVGQCR
jgi:hypothetical protein